MLPRFILEGRLTSNFGGDCVLGRKFFLVVNSEIFVFSFILTGASCRTSFFFSFFLVLV